MYFKRLITLGLAVAVASASSVTLAVDKIFSKQAAKANSYISLTLQNNIGASISRLQPNGKTYGLPKTMSAKGVPQTVSIPSSVANNGFNIVYEDGNRGGCIIFISMDRENYVRVRVAALGSNAYGCTISQSPVSMMSIGRTYMMNAAVTFTKSN